MNPFSNRKSRRRNRRAPETSDGLDSSYFSSHGRARRDQKTAQLCRQVFRAVSLALGECADDVLRELTVHAVEPAPDASRMLVRVGVSPIAAADTPPHEVLARLEDVSGFLRREVAAAITRKRAPELLFTFAPPAAAADPEVPHE